MKKLIPLLCLILICMAFLACKRTEEAKYYQITFVVGDATYTTQVKEGEMPVFLGSTERPADDAFHYRFDGWDNAFVPVSGDLTYRALYTALPREKSTVTITFVVGSTLTRVETVLGEIPVFEGSTDLSPVDGVSFAFDGWDKELVPAYTNETYIAKYIEGTASYPVRFVFGDEVLATTTVRHGDYAMLPTDVTLPELPEGYDVLWLGVDTAISCERDIFGYLYQGDKDLAKRALSAPTVVEGGSVGESVGAFVYLALYGTEGMRDILFSHLSSLTSLCSEDFTAHEGAMLFIALSLLSERSSEWIGEELLALVEPLGEKNLASENTPLRLISAVFLHTLLGEDRFVAAFGQDFIFEGFTLSTKEALLEKALLLSYSKTVTNGFTKNSVTYAYIADSTITPYEGEVGMLSALCGESTSDAYLASEDMALMSASLLASRSLGICDFAEQRPSVFAKIFVGNADLMYKLVHGYLSFDGQKQRYLTEGNAHPAYLYIKSMYLSQYGDVSFETLSKGENVTGAEHLVSAGTNKANNLTITLSDKADAIIGDGNYYSGDDFLLEFSVLADESTASAEYRIRLYGGTVTCIANVKGTQFVIKNGVLSPLDGAPSSFSLGEYGWHRFGMRFSQQTTLEGGEVCYRLLFTFYLDGETIGTYEGENTLFVENGYLLHTASVKDGALSYGGANQIYFQMYKNGFYNKENTAYFFYLKDVLTSAGEDFVRKVQPLTFDLGDGTFPQDTVLTVLESDIAPSSYTVSDVLHYYLVDEYGILPSPTLPAYRFVGWYADTAFTKHVASISPMKEMPEMLYARYERVANRITLLSDGLLDDVVYLPYTEESLTLPAGTVGFLRLVGWYFDPELTLSELDMAKIQDGKLYISGAYEEGLTLYARWEEFRPEGSVKIVYHIPWADAPLPEDAIAGLLREQIGESIVLPSLISPIGQRFAGWRIDDTGEVISTLVFTEPMSERGEDLHLYAAFVPVAITSAQSTTPADNPNMFYAILQNKDQTTVNLAERPYVSYEFDYTTGMATKSMNFALHTGSGNQLMFFDLDTKGNITLNTLAYSEKQKIATLSEGEHRIAIILEQGDVITENTDGTYTVRYYFDMTLYVDGEVIGTYRTKEDAVFIGENCSYLFYEVVATEDGYKRVTALHTNDHLRVRMRTTSSQKMTGVSSFINDAYLFNTKTPVYLTTVEEEVIE